MTVPLLSEYLGKDKSTVYEQLLVLMSQGYVDKRYDSSFRLPPRPAVYSLANVGIKYLRDTTSLPQATLRNMYKNKTATDPLIARCHASFEIAIKLLKQYPEIFDIYSKSEMTSMKELLRPLPDLYLIKRAKKTVDRHDYLLELLESSVPTWIIRKRIQAYQDHCDESDAEPYPYILFVATNDSTERRVQRILEDSYQDFEFYTTTTERLESQGLKIWRQVFEDDEDDKPILKSLK